MCQFGLSSHSRSKRQWLREWDTRYRHGPVCLLSRAYPVVWRVGRISERWPRTTTHGLGRCPEVWKARVSLELRDPCGTLPAGGRAGLSPHVTTGQVSAPGEGCCLGWAVRPNRPLLPSPSAGFQNKESPAVSSPGIPR